MAESVSKKEKKSKEKWKIQRAVFFLHFSRWRLHPDRFESPPASAALWRHCLRDPKRSKLKFKFFFQNSNFCGKIFAFLNLKKKVFIFYSYEKKRVALGKANNEETELT